MTRLATIEFDGNNLGHNDVQRVRDHIQAAIDICLDKNKKITKLKLSPFKSDKS